MQHYAVVLATSSSLKEGMYSLFIGCLPFSFMSARPSLFKMAETHPDTEQTASRGCSLQDKRVVEVQMFGQSLR